MDLTYPPEAESFRGEIRAWLEENLPEGWFDEGFELRGEERKRFNEEWTAKLHEGGWICASWPEEYGGKGLSVMENVVLNEEFARARAPMRADFFGDTLVGPTILQWGTEEQKKEFLPKILRGQISWCQGFSEPEAGSDLASLKTKAVLDGDEWVINGQKVWTTQAQYADFIFLLARTDPDAPKHKGISYLLVPMRQSGIEIRPIVQITGDSEFNEVFFDGARTGRDEVVGDVNDGWRVAMGTLAFERGASTLGQQMAFRNELDAIVDVARRTGVADDPVMRQRLVQAHIGLELMRLGALRTLAGSERGALGREAMVTKLHWATVHRGLGELAMDVLGAAATVCGEDTGGKYDPTPLQRLFLFTRADTIYGGSNQIQRNIIGERALGLPKEPR
jgi:alkylation response protein AidB-like acyl-CoA dehydrogenase